MIEFLTPVSKKVLAHREILPLGVLGKHLTVYSNKGEWPELKEVRMAIFGVSENRNDINYMGGEIDFDEYRKALYSLYPGNWPFNIADLGDIEKGNTIEDTYYAVQTTVKELLAQNIIPIVIGGSQDLVYAQYRGYDESGSMVNLVNIDRKFDLGDADLPISNTSFVGKIVVNKPYNLFNYSTLGYQTYFNPIQEIALMEKLYFDSYRLGEIVSDIKVVEPILRDADIVCLDMAAIKSSELSYKNGESPNGLDGREICGISRYSGISSRVSSLGVYELPMNIESKAAPMLVAQIIWYFIEGVNFRVVDDDFENEKLFTSYKVPVDNEILRFKKSNKTERWWIELPFISNVNNKLKRHTLLPCTYGEYLSACNQEIPERWLKARRKNEV